MAQARAQVAAESETEAMQQQQLELQVVESFEDNASATQNNDGKSPIVWHHKLPPPTTITTKINPEFFAQ